MIDTGRAHTTITDERGEYRVRGLAPGRYKVQAELSGFTTVVIPDIELLVGQNRSLPFSLQVASLTETLTVTGESPLVDISSTQVAGNVDRRQMEELPLQGRNWMELAMQVKGITANAVDTTPGVRDRQFQLNLDGQEITQQVAGSGFGQPKFSREAIAEFQVVTNLFDITQGRSLGIQVQAVSRSGTNNYDGSVYGYFRDDSWNAKDFIANRVLPYANQQLGGAIGGPLIRDKAHFFLSFERENEPNTILTSVSALPGSSWEFDTKLVQNSFLGRGDWQWTQNDHITARASYWDWGNDFTQVAGTEHPSQAAARYRKAINVVGTWAKVLSSTKLQEVKIGYTHFDWQNLLAVPELANTPNYVFPGGIIFGQRRNYPQEFFQNTFSARYDLTMSAGRHDMKFGAEFLRWHDTGQWQLLSRGEFIFTSTPADLARRFPVDAWDDPTRWDVTGLDSIVQRFDQNFGDWTIDIPRPTWAVWFGDTWRMNDQLTVNYGVRWDADWGALDPPHITTEATFDPVGGAPYPDIDLGPGDMLYPNNLRDIGSVAPRAGFTWNVGGGGNLVIRGGSGLYYSIPDSNTTFSAQSFNGERILVNSFPNDGQPGFIQDPTRGRTPEDYLSGRYPVPPQGPRVIAHDYQMPSTWQSIIGMQKQIGPQMGVEADFTHWKGYNFARQRDPNLFFNPATGYNRNPAQGRPDPEVRADPVARVERQGRLRGDLDRAQSPLRQQLAGIPVIHLHVVLERQHHQLPVPGQQPVRSGSRVGTCHGLPAPHAALQRHLAAAARHLGVGCLPVRIGQLLRHDRGPQSLRPHRHDTVELRHDGVRDSRLAPGVSDQSRRGVGVGSLRWAGLDRAGHDRAAQRPAGAAAAPHRLPGVEGSQPAGRDSPDRNRRSVQRHQPCQLRRLQRADQFDDVRAAAPEPAERVSAARHAAGLQGELLTMSDCGSSGWRINGRSPIEN